MEHQLGEMLAQRIYGLALGYEDLNDHKQLRRDPLFGVLSGKRELDNPLAGKSTLNRLELVGRTGRYHKISCSAEAIDRLLGDLHIESHAVMPERIVLDLDATDIPLYGHRRSASSTATTTATATCRCTSSPMTGCCVRGSDRPTRMRPPARSMKWSASSDNCGRAGPRSRSCCLYQPPSIKLKSNVRKISYVIRPEKRAYQLTSLLNHPIAKDGTVGSTPSGTDEDMLAQPVMRARWHLEAG